MQTEPTQKHRDGAESKPARPRGFVPIGVFFVFGATMAAYAAVTLWRPGTFLDALWTLNKHGHMQLAALGRIAAMPFALVSAALASAAVGWLRRRYWGWVLGVSIIAINALGDLVDLAIGERWKGAIGVVIAGVLLAYMISRRVRSYFAPR